jgi:hypothetical protein
VSCAADPVHAPSIRRWDKKKQLEQSLPLAFVDEDAAAGVSEEAAGAEEAAAAAAGAPPADCRLSCTQR